jgi:nitrite reductase/ring-hydroxylating ferredoxin subunit
VCPRHGWRFDLEQGGVDVRSGTSINAIRVREPRPGN